jgi:hypothetical protein
LEERQFEICLRLLNSPFFPKKRSAQGIVFVPPSGANFHAKNLPVKFNGTLQIGHGETEMVNACDIAHDLLLSML